MAREDHDRWRQLHPCPACAGTGQGDGPLGTCAACLGDGIDPEASHDGDPQDVS